MTGAYTDLEKTWCYNFLLGSFTHHSYAAFWRRSYTCFMFGKYWNMTFGSVSKFGGSIALIYNLSVMNEKRETKYTDTNLPRFFLL